jgi:hypothetical protein
LLQKGTHGGSGGDCDEHTVQMGRGAPAELCMTNSLCTLRRTCGGQASR